MITGLPSYGVITSWNGTVCPVAKDVISSPKTGSSVVRNRCADIRWSWCNYFLVSVPQSVVFFVRRILDCRILSDLKKKNVLERITILYITAGVPQCIDTFTVQEVSVKHLGVLVNFFIKQSLETL